MNHELFKYTSMAILAIVILAMAWAIKNKRIYINANKLLSIMLLASLEVIISFVFCYYFNLDFYWILPMAAGMLILPPVIFLIIKGFSLSKSD